MVARPDDIFDLISSNNGSDIDVLQGYLTAWNGTTYANTVTVNGTSLTNLNLIHTSDPALLVVNTIIAVLRIKSAYYILGRISIP